MLCAISLIGLVSLTPTYNKTNDNQQKATKWRQATSDDFIINQTTDK